MEIYVNVVNYFKAKENVDGIFHKRFYTALPEILKKKAEQYQMNRSRGWLFQAHYTGTFSLSCLSISPCHPAFPEHTFLPRNIMPLQTREMSAPDLLTKQTTDIIYLTRDQFIKLGNILVAVKARHLIQSRLLKMQRVAYIFKMR